MKKIKYILFTISILILSTLSVNAECTKEELNTLKQEANKIKVTYKHLGAIKDGENIVYNRFRITIRNVNDDLKVYIPAYEAELKKENDVIEYELGTGNWSLDIYSDKCEEMIRSISFRLPTFNEYSLDPLCKGIDGDDFKLCGKYLEYQVSYDTFKKKVEEYRNTHNIKENAEDKTTKEDNITIKKILNELLKYVIDYQIYIIVVLGIILLILIVLIIIQKKKKRGVLE